ncbi:hypothetical protein NCAS_0B05880 [Naumovozyma castellii]|uniref:C2H2-type domain-containing protein n=1 Tax=Naumovozyma castellii TaxID=27288 RepID=G0V9Q5_NAUCA|nr:hypothetical protein NCAS_0B05880 [Naumovozyma castellii CBS 4309]CCC68672.1 hypothetical protein NCAS_0B05880 [Naumovozyma castellii CBS 4309]
MSNFGRRTWDKEEYAIQAQTKSLHESLKHTLTASELSELKIRYTNYDQLMKDSIKGINQKVLTTGLTSYKKGKQFGFYCEICDLTFKDSLQFIDHLNHKTHEIKFELTFDEPLVLDTRDNDDIEIDEFSNSLKENVKAFVKIHKAKPKRDKDASVKKQRKKNKIITNTNSEIHSMMGFTEFGNSKS